MIDGSELTREQALALETGTPIWVRRGGASRWTRARVWIVREADEIDGYGPWASVLYHAERSTPTKPHAVLIPSADRIMLR